MLALEPVYMPAFPSEYRGPLFPLVPKRPSLFDSSPPKLPAESPACLRPSPRPQGPRRERERSREQVHTLTCSRHAPCDRSAWPETRSQDLPIPFPLDPLPTKGREETSWWGGILISVSPLGATTCPIAVFKTRLVAAPGQLCEKFLPWKQPSASYAPRSSSERFPSLCSK